ncbi:MAG TPA: hypothetical protein ENJ10_00050 [Caldithrix abyssi]|uniref:Uncharacterized protein n=1 Tax=Caldithrix abyssi TaxID=187145 RepID=A0A7V1LJX3_CALAY|nr:hypothetical protein [Caldithrix abyssi]
MRKTYRGNFSNFGQSFPWVGLGLVLFGITVIIFPRILVALIAIPIIFSGILFLSRWFYNRSNRNGFIEF